MQAHFSIPRPRDFNADGEFPVPGKLLGGRAINMEPQGGGPGVLNNLVKVFLCDQHGSSLGFANSITSGAFELSALIGIVDAEGRLRRAEEEITIGFQNSSDFGEDCFLGLDTEVN